MQPNEVIKGFVLKQLFRLLKALFEYVQHGVNWIAENLSATVGIAYVKER